MECLEPPLREVPVDEWFCPECVVPSTASAAGNALSLSHRTLRPFPMGPAVLEKSCRVGLVCVWAGPQGFSRG